MFRTIDKLKINENNSAEVKKWLYHRGIPFSKEVFLSRQPNEGLILPWKMVIKYYTEFTSGDVSVIDNSLNWALLFYHENEIYVGTNEKFIPSVGSPNEEFIW